MNKYENGVIKYQISLEKYKNGQANEVVALLDKANAIIAKEIKRTNGVYTKARYKEINKKLTEVAKALKEKVGKNTDLDGLIDLELKQQKKLLNAVKNEIVNVKGGKVDFLYPSREQIKTSALFKPVDVKSGMTYESYLDGIETGLYNIWDAQVRTGYLTGLTSNQIVSNVIGGMTPEARLKNAGIMQTLRNSVYSNTRTVLQSFANETRSRIMEENEDIFDKDAYKYEWLSTLDRHACLVCSELSGKLFKSLKDVEQPPIHRNCRCLIIFHFDIEGDKRSSEKGYVDSDLSFEGWLKQQDETTQKEVLGKTRYEMFKNGKAIKDFVDDGHVLTLKELEKYN